MNPRRLYRSRDRQLAGVAGGMAEYLNIDPTVSRILWILAAIVSVGFVILAYIVLAIVIPENPYATSTPPMGANPGYGPAGYAGYGQPGSAAWTDYGQSGYGQPGSAAWAEAAGSPAWTGSTGSATPPPSPAWSPTCATPAAAEAQARPQARGRGFGGAAIVGVVLVVIGAIALADAVLPGWSSAVVLGPAVIIALGAALLVASIGRRDVPVAPPASPVAPMETPAGTAMPGASAAESSTWTAQPVATDVSTDTQPVDRAALA